MKKGILVFCALLLLIVACGKVETTAPTPTTPKVTTPAPQSPGAATPEPAAAPVREVDYESIFKLQYCNYTIANLDYDVSRAKEQQEDAEQSLTRTQDELAGESDSNAKNALQEDISEYKSTIEDMKKEATDKQAKLADTISKCNTLEKKKDGAICKAFIADAQKQLDEFQVTLAGEQEDLQQAMENNVQLKIVKNQRNVAAAQARVTKMQGILNELQQRCA